ncbi:MAG: RHS repeat domain-containing protein [Caulobacteraceae bacterium]
MRLFHVLPALLGLVLGALWPPPPVMAQVTQSVTYDALGRVVSVITADGKQTIYSYDAKIRSGSDFNARAVSTISGDRCRPSADRR